MQPLSAQFHFLARIEFGESHSILGSNGKPIHYRDLVLHAQDGGTFEIQLFADTAAPLTPIDADQAQPPRDALADLVVDDIGAPVPEVTQHGNEVLREQLGAFVAELKNSYGRGISRNTVVKRIEEALAPVPVTRWHAKADGSKGEPWPYEAKP